MPKGGLHPIEQQTLMKVSAIYPGLKDYLPQPAIPLPSYCPQQTKDEEDVTEEKQTGIN